MQILIAEDDPVSRKILETSLKKWGYEVIVACDGKEALEHVENNESSFAILDWMMPGADGVEISRRIRDSARDKYTYIILLTAKGTKEDILAGLEAGADDYIIKPFDIGELKYRLRVGERILALQDHLSFQLNEISKANEKMRDDLAAASSIQKGMLPSILPSCEHIKFDYSVIPCEEVGGDMLNIFRLDENHIAIWVFDVAGHGVAAAMYAVMIGRVLSPSNNGSSQVKRVIDKFPYFELVSPSEVVRLLNNQFCLDNQEKSAIFSTLIYGILDTDTLKFTFANAGHPKPILARKGECSIVQCAGNLPIGIMSDNEYPLNEIMLEKGDRLFFYTDGINEARNVLNNSFGTKRMISILESQDQTPLRDRLKSVVDSVVEWGRLSRKQDDITIIGVEID